MQLRTNVIWGVILMIFGGLLLANNYDMIDIEFRDIAKLWPLLLILAGLNHIFAKQTGMSNSSVTTLLVILSIPLAITALVDRNVDRFENRWENRMDDVFEEDDNDDNDGTYSGDSTRKYDDETTTESETLGTTDYKVDFANEETAKLDLGAGASKISLVEETKNLFVAESNGTKPLKYKLSTEKNTGSADLRFHVVKININKDLDETDYKHNYELKFGLNPKPVWDLNLSIGAADTDLNLEKFKVRKLKLKTGASDTEIKLGGLLKESDVKIESGAASIKIKVPKGVGCYVDFDGILNDHNLDGFTSKGSGRYETDNYKNAASKINIDVKSGVSSIDIERY